MATTTITDIITTVVSMARIIRSPERSALGSFYRA